MWRDHQGWAIKLPLCWATNSAAPSPRSAQASENFKVGDRVAVETAAEVCGSCAYCHSGDYNQCPHRLGYGALYDGAFTKYVAARQAILHRIPENVSFEQASLTEPICVAYNALVEKTPNVRPGDTVVIQGPGPIGMMALLVAKLRGASEIIMLGTRHDQQRLAVAAEIGATQTLNIDLADPLDLVRSLGDWLRRGLGRRLQRRQHRLEVSNGDGPPQRHHHQRSAGARSHSTSILIRWCRKQSRYRAASATYTIPGSGRWLCFRVGRST